MNLTEIYNTVFHVNDLRVGMKLKIIESYYEESDFNDDEYIPQVGDIVIVYHIDQPCPEKHDTFYRYRGAICNRCICRTAFYFMIEGSENNERYSSCFCKVSTLSGKRVVE